MSRNFSFRCWWNAPRRLTSNRFCVSGDCALAIRTVLFSCSNAIKLHWRSGFCMHTDAFPMLHLKYGLDCVTAIPTCPPWVVSCSPNGRSHPFSGQQHSCGRCIVSWQKKSRLDILVFFSSLTYSSSFPTAPAFPSRPTNLHAHLPASLSPLQQWRLRPPA